MEQIHRLNDLIGRSNQSLDMILVPHEIVDSPEAKNINIHKGEIVFQDVHFQLELLAKNGLYKTLWGSQVGGFLLDSDE